MKVLNLKNLTIFYLTCKMLLASGTFLKLIINCQCRYLCEMCQ